MQKFKLGTLSDSQTVENFPRLRDPFTVILSAIPSILSIVGKTPLTLNDLNAVFPGNGYYTTALKTFLLTQIAWKDDLLTKHIDMKMKAYIQKFYSFEKCQDLRAAGCFAIKSYPDVYECDECTQRFYNELQAEGGIIKTAGTPGYPGTIFSGDINWQTIALIGGGLFLLLAVTKKRKRK